MHARVTTFSRCISSLVTTTHTPAAYKTLQCGQFVIQRNPLWRNDHKSVDLCNHKILPYRLFAPRVIVDSIGGSVFLKHGIYTHHACSGQGWYQSIIVLFTMPVAEGQTPDYIIYIHHACSGQGWYQSIIVLFTMPVAGGQTPDYIIYTVIMLARARADTSLLLCCWPCLEPGANTRLYYIYTSCC